MYLMYQCVEKRLRDKITTPLQKQTSSTCRKQLRTGNYSPAAPRSCVVYNGFWKYFYHAEIKEMENNHPYLSKCGIQMTLITPAPTASTLLEYLYSENPMTQESVDRPKLQEKNRREEVTYSRLERSVAVQNPEPRSPKI